MKHIIILILLLISSGVAACEPIEFNHTEAFASINNLSNFSYNMSMRSENFSVLNTMIYYNESKTESENLVTMVFAPITQYWASDDVLGYWTYVLIIVSTIFIVYGKTKSLETTTLTTLMSTICVTVAESEGHVVIPGMVKGVIYAITALMFCGVLLGFFGGED